VLKQAVELLALDSHCVRELVGGGRPAVDGAELLARLADVTLPAAQRARRPVLAPELVQRGAVDAGPRVLLEGRAALWIEAVDSGDQRLQPAREQIVNLAPGGELANLPVHDVLDDPRVGDHQAVPDPGIARPAVLRV